MVIVWVHMKTALISQSSPLQYLVCTLSVSIDILEGIFIVMSSFVSISSLKYSEIYAVKYMLQYKNFVTLFTVQRESQFGIKVKESAIFEW